MGLEVALPLVPRVRVANQALAPHLRRVQDVRARAHPALVDVAAPGHGEAVPVRLQVVVIVRGDAAWALAAPDGRGPALHARRQVGCRLARYERRQVVVARGQRRGIAEEEAPARGETRDAHAARRGLGIRGHGGRIEDVAL